MVKELTKTIKILLKKEGYKVLSTKYLKEFNLLNINLDIVASKFTGLRNALTVIKQITVEEPVTIGLHWDLMSIAKKYKNKAHLFSNRSFIIDLMSAK